MVKWGCNVMWRCIVEALAPVASFTKEVNPRLAKRPLKTIGFLANRELIFLVKEATYGNYITYFWTKFNQNTPNELFDVGFCLYSRNPL